MSASPVRDGVRLVSVADAEALYELRAREYAQATQFEMTRPELLRWSEHDAAGTVVGAWCDGELVATLRGVVAPDRVAAEDLFCCTVDLAPDLFPALMFGRGATDARFQRRGLNALLRLYMLRALDPVDGRLRCSLALPYEGAPRLNLLRELGYEMHRPRETWDVEARERTPVLLAVLPRRRFASARACLELLCRENLERLTWIGAPLEITADLVLA